jgi:hypothetical protein
MVMDEEKMPPHWRVLRWMREKAGRDALRKTRPQKLAETVSMQIKSDKDARGKRRGSAEN